MAGREFGMGSGVHHDTRRISPLFHRMTTNNRMREGDSRLGRENADRIGCELECNSEVRDASDSGERGGCLD